MLDLEKQVKQLRDLIFDMLNFTNIYILVLNEKMEIKFINNSLAKDLGFENYKKLLGINWINFVDNKDKNLVKEAHYAIANDTNDWEDYYKEVKNYIKTKNNKLIEVYWFNSHINSNYNWTFSFGIKKKQEVKINTIRDYYQDIINKDRIMINSLRDVLGIKNNKFSVEN